MSDPLPRVRRILTLIPLLRQNPGISIGELCRMLNLSRKELKRDLDRISLCGYPPYLPHNYISVLYEGEKVYLDYADHFARPVQLSLGEGIALKFAFQSLPPVEREEEEELLRNIEAQVDELLRRQGTDLTALDERVKGGAAVSDEVAARWRQLHSALRERAPVEIVYYSRSSEEVTRRAVSPWGLVERRGNHYLIGYCHSREDPRNFRLDRIHSIAPSAAEYRPCPEDFDLEAYAARIAPGGQFRVRARFDRSIARFVQEEYEGQAMETLPSGDVVVELNAGTVAWAVGHFLGYGEHVEVLEPPEVRREMARRLRGFLETVRGNGGEGGAGGTGE